MTDSKNCNFCGKNEHEKEVGYVVVSEEHGGCICRDCIFMALSYSDDMEKILNPKD
jgi:hypothetical protein